MRSVLRNAAHTPVALASSPIETCTKPGISLAIARSRIFDSKWRILCIERYISSSLSLPTSIAVGLPSNLRGDSQARVPGALQLVRSSAKRQMCQWHRLLACGLPHTAGCDATNSGLGDKVHSWLFVNSNALRWNFSRLGRWPTLRKLISVAIKHS